MKVELHCHTSRYSGCSRQAPEEVLAELLRCGYEAVYLTEHNRVWPNDELAELRKEFSGIHIFPGIELSDGILPQDLLVLGTNDPTYVELARASRWPDVLDKARAEEHLTILAHPCRFPQGHDMLHHRLRPDALEYRTGNHDDVMALTTCVIAERRRMPMVNAGDIHAAEMVDHFWVETSRPVERATDIRQIIRERDYHNCEGA
jgi:predicted metal-dependent phosphoesterase TrpH